MRAIDLILVTKKKHLGYELRISCKDVEYIKNNPLKSKRCKISYFRGIVDFKFSLTRKTIILRDYYKLCKEEVIEDLAYLLMYDEKNKITVYFKTIIIDNENKFIILI